MNNSINNLIKLESRKIICIDDSSIKSYLLSQAEAKPLKTEKKQVIDEQTIIERESKTQINMIGGVYIDINNVEFVLMSYINKQKLKMNQQMVARFDIGFDNKNYSALRDNTMILMDEFDSLVDPMKSDLNFPYGTLKNLDHQIFLNKLVVSITEMLFVNYYEYMMYSDRSNKKTNKLIIRSIMNSIDCNKYDTIFKIYNEMSTKVKNINKDIQIEQFADISPDEIKQIDQSHSKKNNQSHNGGTMRKNQVPIKQRGGSKESLMMFFIREVYTTYIMCMEMMLDKDYGWDETANNPFVVIPFSAQKTPMKGSKFSNPIINIILTSISYFSKSFRIVDSSELIKYIKYLIKSTSRDHTMNEKKLDTNGIDLAMIDDSVTFSVYMQDLKTSNQDIYYNYIRMYLEEVILNIYITVDPNIYNCSFIDIIDPHFIKSKVALSGTVNVHLPLFKYYGKTDKLSSIIEDDITKNKIEKALIGVDDIGNPTQVKTLMLEDLNIPNNIRNSPDLPTAIGNLINKLDNGNYAIVYSIIALLGNNIDENKNYNVIIDVGSFLRNYENYEFALLVSHFYSDRNVVFFDSNDQPVAMRGMKIVSFDVKSLKQDIRTKVIFDQKHTIGTDLDLHSMSRGIVTVNNMTTKTSLIQGIFRLREVDLKQQITYLAKDIRQTTEQLVVNVNTRETRIFNKSKIKYYQQTILCLLRRYDQYSRESYQYRFFIPNMEMSEQIFNKGNYNHDYKKEEFIIYVNKCLENIDQSYTSNDTMNNIKSEILEYLNEVINFEVEDNSVMIQRQTNVQKQINYQSEKETNNYRNRFDKRSIVFDKNPVYNLDIKPTTIQTHIDFGKVIEDDEMMIYLKKLNIYMSPGAAYAVYKTYQEGETDDLFYMAFYEIDKNPKIMLYTSIDIIVLFSHNKSLLDNLIKIDKFVTNGSPESFSQNIIMLLLFKIPDTHTMVYFESQTQLRDLAQIIKNHYKNMFKYNIRSISKRFSDFIHLE